MRVAAQLEMVRMWEEERREKRKADKKGMGWGENRVGERQ